MTNLGLLVTFLALFFATTALFAWAMRRVAVALVIVLAALDERWR